MKNKHGQQTAEERHGKNPVGTGKPSPGWRWRGRLWLEGDEGTFLGYGRVVLLERIADCGSISQAAKSMEMSYKHAWDLLDSMNRQAGCKLVETIRGGKAGGGARLTPAGQQAIALFREFHEEFQLIMQAMSSRLAGLLLPQPDDTWEEGKERKR